MPRAVLSPSIAVPELLACKSHTVPLFGRLRKARVSARQQFTVGVEGHRVLIAERGEGCSFIEGIDDWVDSVSRRNAARPRSDGRDSVALLNAKMDYVDMVGDAVSVVTLVFEELSQRGLVETAAVPAVAGGDRINETRTYEYIRDAYARALERRRWLESADALLREFGVTVLPPPERGE